MTVQKDKLVPVLRFPGFEGEWRSLKLKDVSNIYDGTHQTPKYVSEGVKFVSVENIGNLQETNKFITPEAFEKGFKVKPQDGDILMTRITAGIIGATAIVENNDPLAYYVSLALIRSKSIVLFQFLNQAINSYQFKRELHKRIIHVAFPKKINLGDIGYCGISIPTLPEQQKIATFLTTIDTRIQQLSRKVELLEQYKKGVMQRIFSQEIRFKDEGGRAFPEWEELKLKHVIIDIKSGKTKPQEEGKYVVYGSTGPLGQCNQFTHSGDYLLIARVGANAGFLNLVSGQFSVTDNTLILEIKAPNILSFIYYALLKYNLNRLVSGSGQPLITGGQLKNMKIYFPSPAEQQKIASFLTTIDQKITQTKSQLQHLQTFKKGLLQQLFV